MSALLTGGRGDALCPSPEAEVGWRFLPAAAPLSVPHQDTQHELGLQSCLPEAFLQGRGKLSNGA